MNVWKFPYITSEQDFLDFNEHFLLKTSEGKKAMLLYRLICPATFFIFTVFHFMTNKDITVLILLLIMFSIVSVIMWFNCHRLILAIFRHQLKKKQSIERSLFSSNGTLIFDFDNRIIIDSSEKEELRVRFEGIEVFYETERAYYLYFGKAKAFILPYSAFRSADEFYAFQRILRGTFPAGNI